MIHRKTVFVLGAGASMPYGFPSGDQLIDEIVAIASDQDCMRTFRLANFKEEDVEAFARDLADSDPPSIDSFLEYRQEFLQIGKLAIVLALAGKQLDSTLSRSYRKEPAGQRAWYDYLWREMLASKDHFGDNKVAFVTFNYDRSLERYFSLRLKAQHGFLRISEALKDLYRIPFLHIYGALGDQHFTVNLYEAEHTHADLTSMAKGLTLIHEDPSGNPNFPAAIEQLKKAERICFLGYGFHELNNNGLDLVQLAADDGLKEQAWFASRFNLTDVEFRRRTAGFYHRFLYQSYTKERVGHESDGALDVLRKLPVI